MLLELFQNNSDDNLNSFGLLFLKEVFKISRNTYYFKKKRVLESLGLSVAA